MLGCYPVGCEPLADATLLLGPSLTDGVTLADTLAVVQTAAPPNPDGVVVTDTLAIEVAMSDGVTVYDSAVVPRYGNALPVVRDSSRLEPVYLVQITLKNGGPVLYFSDRNITVGAQVYESYLHDLAGLAQELRRADSTALNVNLELSFRNLEISYGGTDYAYLIELGQSYPFETSVCAIFETAYDMTGLPAAPELVFQGVLDCPENVDLMGFKCKVSTMPTYMDARWVQTQLNIVDFPAATDDVGKWVPLVYGSNILMPALRVDWATTTLVNALGMSSTDFQVTSVQGFASSGLVLIDNEVIKYTGISGNTLTGIWRNSAGPPGGLPGVTAPHQANAHVVPYLPYYDWVLAAHPLSSVGDIFAEINGRLWMVTSGVEYLFDTDGFAKLRASDVIWVSGVLDNISVDDAITVGDDIAYQDTGHKHQMSTPTDNMNHTQTTTVPLPSLAQLSGNDLVATLTFNAPPFAPTKILWTIEGWVDEPPDSPVLLFSADGMEANGYLVGPTPFFSEGWFKIQMMSTYIESTNECSIQLSGSASLSGTSCVMEVTACSRIIYGTETADTSVAALVKGGSAYRAGVVSKLGTVVQTHMIERLHAVASGYADDASGTYTGTPGAVIEQPDSVIKHFLEVASGVFSSSAVDGASFAAAGQWYAANSYAFGFCLDKKIRPSQWLSQLAWEARSTLVYNNGLWELNVIPDAAPAAVKTIAKADLAGRFSAFTFGKTPWRKVSNYLTASYDRVYSTIPVKSQSGWLGSVHAQDPGSQATYGIFKKDLQFEAIRTNAMAQSVLNHMLLEAKTPNMTVEFPVFWENFDLNVGDTIAISNDIFNGMLFFIEEIKRKDAFRASVKAVGWWA